MASLTSMSPTSIAWAKGYVIVTKMLPGKSSRRCSANEGEVSFEHPLQGGLEHPDDKTAWLSDSLSDPHRSSVD